MYYVSQREKNVAYIYGYKPDEPYLEAEEIPGPEGLENTLCVDIYDKKLWWEYRIPEQPQTGHLSAEEIDFVKGLIDGAGGIA